jgi:pyruvate kinase
MTTEEAVAHLFPPEAVAHMKRELQANEERVPKRTSRKPKSSITE